MKKSIIITLLVTGVLIILLNPLIKDYQEKKQYDFELNTLKSKIVKEDFEGKVLAVFFGYTFCPDVCPTTLSTLSFAINALPKDKQKDVQGLLISVDPQRDTLPLLNDYAKYFNPSFIGATSDKKTIDDITKRYSVFYQKVEDDNSAMEYSVSHSSYVFIFNKDGKMVKRINYSQDVDEITKILKELL